LKDKKKKNPRKSEWPQTHTLDLAATGIGSWQLSILMERSIFDSMWNSFFC
jgi:hypothetical protein